MNVGIAQILYGTLFLCAAAIPCGLARSGKLTPGRWIAVAFGSFLLAAGCMILFVGSSGLAYLGSSINHVEANAWAISRRVWLFATVITSGWGLGSIFACAFHRSHPGRVASGRPTQSFLLDDKQW